MLLELLTLASYLLALLQIWRRQPFIYLLTAAALLQIASLLLAPNFSFTASMSWLTALMSLGSLWFAHLKERFLPFIASVASILAIGAHLAFPGHLIPGGGWQIHLHAALALTAHAVLLLAGLQAILLLVAEQRLRQRSQPADADWVPPLSRLERQLFQLIGIGFGLLSLTLVSGSLFISDWFAQHIVHKTVLTVLAWVIFAALIFARAKLGWRGRRAAITTLIALAVLLLAFLGSKFVLEVILRRV